ncbi:acetyl-CoA acetyltransferase [Paraburkholderia phytofirmans OLGA172]|uniref:Acetyl-CoA acetyltransferase n=1 Tax=Paraburkholderia phytofirmans OLGA172 TaxID=1417228 RepID=A0A160FSK4_9BURK|nr:thiolase family protein [Paraburkholderia phytofirmans]ANB75872.1 acetyl-CoA acetyltransferase [Paraburkholderia phytofirmans OLGA172]
MEAREVVICNPVRTPIGAFGGSLKDVPAVDLGAVAVRETLRRSGADASKINSVVMGNVIQAGNKMNPARQAAIGAGLPVEVPALTVNRVCGSGAQAIVNAAQEIWLGFADASIAGGMESMERAPYLLPNARWGQRMGHAQVYDSMLRDGLVDAFSDEHSGWHTEDLVAEMRMTREQQDSWAARSQQRFTAAQARGLFDGELVGVEIKGKKGAAVFSQDEQPRPDSTVEALAKLRPAFRPDGTITAGNAPGLNSGAAAMLVASREFADAHGIAPAARLVAYGVAAVKPGMFGLGPVPAVEIALQRAGWKLSDVDRVEINEAFAAVPLAVIQTLGLAEDIVNVEGGAIAHGHAIGATGAVLTTRLIHSMRRDNLKRGIVTLCIGGGQGIALAIETI